MALECATDVAKFLYHTKPEELTSRLLLSRTAILAYNNKLEEVGVQASGRQTKLRRIDWAIDFLLLSEEGADDEPELMRKCKLVASLLKQLNSTMGKERSNQEVTRDQDFTPPSLGDVSEFIRSGELTAQSAKLYMGVSKGDKISNTVKTDEMLTVMAHIAYR